MHSGMTPERLMQQYEHAVTSRDPDHLTRLYADDAVVFDALSAWVYESAEG